MKMFNFDYGSLFLRVQLTEYPNIGSDNGLAPTRRQAIIWTIAGWIIMRHSASMS